MSDLACIGTSGSSQGLEECGGSGGDGLGGTGGGDLGLPGRAGRAGTGGGAEDDGLRSVEESGTGGIGFGEETVDDKKSCSSKTFLEHGQIPHFLHPFAAVVSIPAFI